MNEGRINMYILTILLVSTLNMQSHAVLSGKPDYPTLEACQHAGKDVENWLTQDFLTVLWTCTKKER